MNALWYKHGAISVMKNVCTAVGSISKWPNLCRVQDWCEQPSAKRGTPTVKAPRMRSRSYLQVIEDLNAKGMI